MRVRLTRRQALGLGAALAADVWLGELSAAPAPGEQPPPAATRAQAMQSQNNLKQIGLAMHIYHDAQNQLPLPALVDAAGKPLLSWRVAILTYVEEDRLYKQFKLDEPWDSETNKALLAKMPKLYALPGKPKGDPTVTHYQVCAGPGALFEPGKKITFRDVTDGLSNTILAAEAAEGVPWTKPEDLAFDPQKDPPKLGFFKDGYTILMGDGSTRRLKKQLDPAVLKALITRAGGEVIDSNFDK
jgi:hypothetical protein